MPSNASKNMLLFFFSESLMAELLTNEGIGVENDRIVDFKKHFWNPSQELI